MANRRETVFIQNQITSGRYMMSHTEFDILVLSQQPGVNNHGAVISVHGSGGVNRGPEDNLTNWAFHAQGANNTITISGNYNLNNETLGSIGIKQYYLNHYNSTGAWWGSGVVNAPEYAYLDTRYNAFMLKYNGYGDSRDVDVSGAMIFTGNDNKLSLTAQAGAELTQYYWEAKGFDEDTNPLRKTDDNICIRSDAYGIYSYRNNSTPTIPAVDYPVRPKHPSDFENFDAWLVFFDEWHDDENPGAKQKYINEYNKQVEEYNKKVVEFNANLAAKNQEIADIIEDRISNGMRPVAPLEIPEIPLLDIPLDADGNYDPDSEEYKEYQAAYKKFLNAINLAKTYDGAVYVYDGSTGGASQPALATRSYAIYSTGGRLTVTSDLAGSIESNAATLHTGYIIPGDKTNPSASDHSNVELDVRGISAKNLVLENNFRADISAKNNAETFEFATGGDGKDSVYEDEDGKKTLVGGKAGVGYVSPYKKTIAKWIVPQEGNPFIDTGYKTKTGTDGKVTYVSDPDAPSTVITIKDYVTRETKNDKLGNGSAIVAFADGSVTGNKLNAYGIHAGTLTATDGVWSGKITAESSDNSLIADHNYLRAAKGAVHAAVQAEISAYGIKGTSINIGVMDKIQKDYTGKTEKDLLYDAAIYAKANNNFLLALGTGYYTDSGYNPGSARVDVQITAAAIEGTNVTIGKITRDFLLSADTTNNYTEAKTTTKHVEDSVNLTVNSAAYGIKATKFNVDFFDGKIEVKTMVSEDTDIEVYGAGFEFNVKYNMPSGVQTVFGSAGSVTSNVSDVGIGIAAGSINATHNFRGEIDHFAAGFAISVSSDFKVNGVLDTDIETLSYGYLILGNLSVDAFTGSIDNREFQLNVEVTPEDKFYDEGYGLNQNKFSYDYKPMGGISVKGKLDSGVAGDAFDIAGEIYVAGNGWGLLSFSELNIRVSGTIGAYAYGSSKSGLMSALTDDLMSNVTFWGFSSGAASSKPSYGTAIDAERYSDGSAIYLGSSNTDKVELAAGSVVKGAINLGQKENKVTISSQADFDGWLTARGGAINAGFVLEGQGNSKAAFEVVQYHEDDVLLKDSKLIGLNITYAEDGTYKLMDYNYKDADGKDVNYFIDANGQNAYIGDFWKDKEFLINYMNETIQVSFTNVTGNKFTGEGEFANGITVEVSFNAASGEFNVTVDGVAEAEKAGDYRPKVLELSGDVNDYVTLKTVENSKGVSTVIDWKELNSLISSQINTILDGTEKYGLSELNTWQLSYTTSDGTEGKINFYDISGTSYIIEGVSADQIVKWNLTPVQLNSVDFTGDKNVKAKLESKFDSNADGSFITLTWEDLANELDQNTLLGYGLDQLDYYEIVYTLYDRYGRIKEKNVSEFVDSTKTSFDVTCEKGDRISWDIKLHQTSDIDNTSSFTGVNDGVIGNDTSVNLYQQSYDVEKGELTLDWKKLAAKLKAVEENGNQLADYGFTNGIVAYEIEYTLYDEKGDDLGSSIVVRLNSATEKYVISGVDENMAIDWRMRIVGNDSSSLVSKWSDWQKVTAVIEEADSWGYTGFESGVRDIFSMDKIAGVANSVLELSWDGIESDEAIRCYEIEYCRVKNQITMEDAKKAGFDSLDEYLASDKFFDKNKVYTKVVSGNSLVISNENNNGYVYWRVRALNTNADLQKVLGSGDVSNGGVSEWMSGESVRVYANGETTRPNVVTEIGEFVHSANPLTYDAETDISGYICFNGVTDADSGVKEYIVEIVSNLVPDAFKNNTLGESRDIAVWGENITSIQNIYITRNSGVDDDGSITTEQIRAQYQVKDGRVYFVYDAAMNMPGSVVTIEYNNGQKEDVTLWSNANTGGFQLVNHRYEIQKVDEAKRTIAVFSSEISGTFTTADIDKEFRIEYNGETALAAAKIVVDEDGNESIIITSSFAGEFKVGDELTIQSRLAGGEWDEGVSTKVALTADNAKTYDYFVDFGSIDTNLGAEQKYSYSITTKDFLENSSTNSGLNLEIDLDKPFFSTAEDADNLGVYVANTKPASIDADTSLTGYICWDKALDRSSGIRKYVVSLVDANGNVAVDANGDLCSATVDVSQDKTSPAPEDRSMVMLAIDGLEIDRTYEVICSKSAAPLTGVVKNVVVDAEMAKYYGLTEGQMKTVLMFADSGNLIGATVAVEGLGEYVISDVNCRYFDFSVDISQWNISGSGYKVKLEAYDYHNNVSKSETLDFVADHGAPTFKEYTITATFPKGTLKVGETYIVDFGIYGKYEVEAALGEFGTGKFDTDNNEIMEEKAFVRIEVPYSDALGNQKITVYKETYNAVTGKTTIDYVVKNSSAFIKEQVAGYSDWAVSCITPDTVDGDTLLDGYIAWDKAVDADGEIRSYTVIVRDETGKTVKTVTVDRTQTAYGKDDFQSVTKYYNELLVAGEEYKVVVDGVEKFFTAVEDANGTYLTLVVDGYLADKEITAELVPADGVTKEVVADAANTEYDADNDNSVFKYSNDALIVDQVYTVEISRIGEDGEEIVETQLVTAQQDEILDADGVPTGTYGDVYLEIETDGRFNGKTISINFISNEGNPQNITLPEVDEHAFFDSVEPLYIAEWRSAGNELVAGDTYSVSVNGGAAVNVIAYEIEVDGKKVVCLKLASESEITSIEVKDALDNAITGDFTAREYEFAVNVKDWNLTGNKYSYQIIATDEFKKNSAAGDGFIDGFTLDQRNPEFLNKANETICFTDPDAFGKYSAVIGWNDASDDIGIRGYIIRLTANGEVIEFNTMGRVDESAGGEDDSVPVTPVDRIDHTDVAIWSSEKLVSGQQYTVTFTDGDGKEIEIKVTAREEAAGSGSGVRSQAINGVRTICWSGKDFTDDTLVTIRDAAGNIIAENIHGSTEYVNGTYQYAHYKHSWQFDGLTAGEYKYEIFAEDYFGKLTATSASGSIVVDNIKPEFTGSLNEVSWKVVGEYLQPTFQWSAAEDVKGGSGMSHYVIAYRVKGSNDEFVDLISVNHKDGEKVYSYTCPDPSDPNSKLLIDKGTYEYRISAVDKFGNTTVISNVFGSNDWEGPHGTPSDLNVNVQINNDEVAGLQSAEVRINWNFGNTADAAWFRVMIEDIETGKSYIFWQAASGNVAQSMVFNNSTPGRPVDIFDGMGKFTVYVDAFDASYNQGRENAILNYTFSESEKIKSTENNFTPAPVGVDVIPASRVDGVNTDKIGLTWMSPNEQLGVYYYEVAMVDKDGNTVYSGSTLYRTDSDSPVEDHFSTDMDPDCVSVVNKSAYSQITISDLKKFFGVATIVDGEYQVVVTAYDAQGNASTSTSTATMVDTSRPGAVEITNGRALEMKLGGYKRNQLILEWAPVEDASGIDYYEITYGLKGTDPADWFKGTTKENSFSAVINNNGSATEIEYRVVAIDIAGNRGIAWSDSKSLEIVPDNYYDTLLAATPVDLGDVDGAVYNIADESVGSGDSADTFKIETTYSRTVKLQAADFRKLVGENGYVTIEVFKGAGYEAVKSLTYSADNAAEDLTLDLDGGTTYYFKVTNADPNGASVSSYDLTMTQTTVNTDETWFRLDGVTATAVDADGSSKDNVITGEAKFTWDAIETGNAAGSGLAGYELQYVISDEAFTAAELAAGIFDNAVQVKNITGTGYEIDFTNNPGYVYWRVRGVNENGKVSSWISGNNFAAVAAADTVAPEFAGKKSALIGFSYTLPNDSSGINPEAEITLQGSIVWQAASDDNSGVKEYRIQLSTDGGKGYSAWQTIDASQLSASSRFSYSHKNLKNGNVYAVNIDGKEYKAVAINGTVTFEGVGNWLGNIVNITNAGVNVFNGVAITADNCTLFDYTYTFNDLPGNSSSYFYRIQALDYSGNPSEFIYGQELVADKGAPVFFENSSVEVKDSENKITIIPTISWKAAKDVTGDPGVRYYEIYVWEDGLAESELLKLTPVVRVAAEKGKVDYSVVLDDELNLKDGNYQYRVLAVDYFGNSAVAGGSFGSPDTDAPIGQFVNDSFKEVISAEYVRVMQDFDQYGNAVSSPYIEGEKSESSSGSSSGSSSSDGEQEIEITPKVVKSILTQAEVTLDWDDTFTDAAHYKVVISNNPGFQGEELSNDGFKYYSFWTTDEEAADKKMVFDTSTLGRPVGVFEGMSTVYYYIFAYDEHYNKAIVSSGLQTFEFVYDKDGDGIKDPITAADSFDNNANPAVPTVKAPEIVRKNGRNTDVITLEWENLNERLGVYYYRLQLYKDGAKEPLSDVTTLDFSDKKAFDFIGSVNGGEGNATVMTVSDLKAVFGLTSLEDGSYTVKVFSVDASGRSSEGNNCSFVLDTVAPGMVEVTEAELVVGGTGKEGDARNLLILKWNPVEDASGIDHYEVFFRIVDENNNVVSGDWLHKDVGLITDTGKLPIDKMVSFNASDVQANMKCQFYVVAIDKYGNIGEIPPDNFMSLDAVTDGCSDSLSNPSEFEEIITDKRFRMADTVGQYDVDTAKLTVGSGETLTLTVAELEANFGKQDITIEVFNADNLNKAVNTFKVGAAGNVVNNMMLNAGDYVFRIKSAYTGSSSVDYSLIVDKKAFAADNTDNDTASDAKLGTDGIGTSDWVGFADAVDYKYLEISETGRYIISLDDVAAAVKVTIYDANGKKVSGGALSGNQNQLDGISTKPLLLEAGRYYVEVKPGNAKLLGTEYTISAECVETISAGKLNDSANDEVATPFTGKVNNWVGIINAKEGKQDKVDLYSFTAAAGGVHSFKLSDITAGSIKMSISWVDPATGKVKTQSFNPGNKVDSAVFSADLISGVEYTVKVEAAGNGKSSDYELDIVDRSADFRKDDDIDLKNWVVGSEVETLYVDAPEQGGVGLDARDYWKLDLDGSGIYDLTLSDLTNNAKLTLVEYNTLTGKSKTTTVSAGDSRNGVLSGLLIDDANVEYYVGVQAANTKGTGDTGYTLNLTQKGKLETAAEDAVYDGKPLAVKQTGWVGYGDLTDSFTFNADDVSTISVKFADDENETGTVKFQIIDNETGKAVSGSSKMLDAKKAFSISTGSLNLVQGRSYTVEITSVNGAKGVNTSYEVAIDGWNFSDFTTGADNSIAEAKVNPLVFTDGVAKVSGEAVWQKSDKSGDLSDYFCFYALEDGSYSIDLDGINGKAIKVSIGTADNNGKFKSVKSLAGKTDELTLSVDLKANTYYYIKIDSGAKNSASLYDMTVTFNNERDGFNVNDNTVKQVRDDVDAVLTAVEKGGAAQVISDWVGYGDETDVFKVMTDANGQLVFNGDDADTTAALKSKEITLQLADYNGKSVALTFDKESGAYASKSILMADTEYYLTVKSAKPKNQNTDFQIAIGLK